VCEHHVGSLEVAGRIVAGMRREQVSSLPWVSTHAGNYARQRGRAGSMHAEDEDAGGCGIVVPTVVARRRASIGRSSMYLIGRHNRASYGVVFAMILDPNRAGGSMARRAIRVRGQSS
jgi:hypothetical protein